MEPFCQQLETSTLKSNFKSSLAIVTSGANRLCVWEGTNYGIQGSKLSLTHTFTYIPTAVERGEVNQNRRRGVVFDDDGSGQVGRSQSA